MVKLFVPGSRPWYHWYPRHRSSFLFFFCWRKRKMQKLCLGWNYWSIILFRVGWRQIIHCLTVCLSVSIMINSVASLGRDLIEVSFDQTISLTWHFAGKAPKCHHGLITWHRPLHTTGHLEPPGSCAKTIGTTWDMSKSEVVQIVEPSLEGSNFLTDWVKVTAEKRPNLIH